MTDYYMKYVSEHKLKKLGFKESGEWWTFRFPCYKWNKITTIWGQIKVNEDRDVQIDVLQNNGEIYPPFYKLMYGNYDAMLKIINASITNKLKQLGIRERHYGKRYKN